MRSAVRRADAQRARFIRLEDLVFPPRPPSPGLTPTAAQVAAEAELLQRDKDGVEIDQGIFLAHVLASETAGRHLCHAMLLPRPESTELLKKLEVDGGVDLGAVHVKRRGKATFVTASNPRFLNAEDDTTIDAMEIAVDLAILASRNRGCRAARRRRSSTEISRAAGCSAPASI